MYQIICQMCPPEAKSFLPGRRLLESKISRKIKYGIQTQHISKGIGCIDMTEIVQDKINGIVQSCIKKAYHYKSQELGYLFQFIHFH